MCPPHPTPLLKEREKLSVQLVSRGEEERLLAIRHTEQSEVSLAVLVWINPSPNLSLGEE